MKTFVFPSVFAGAPQLGVLRGAKWGTSLPKSHPFETFGNIFGPILLVKSSSFLDFTKKSVCLGNTSTAFSFFLSTWSCGGSHTSTSTLESAF